MLCPLCHRTINPKAAWKVAADRFYCSEFCAESETYIPVRQHVSKELMDRLYLQRLERLLPLRQARTA